VLFPKRSDNDFSSQIVNKYFPLETSQIPRNRAGTLPGKALSLLCFPRIWLFPVQISSPLFGWRI
jgi:hypothetical protein